MGFGYARARNHHVGGRHQLPKPLGTGGLNQLDARARGERPGLRAGGVVDRHHAGGPVA
jgi:hypothetical protein